MKKNVSINLIVFLMIFTVSALADNSNTTGTLKILLDGFKNDKGNAMLALYNSTETYTKSENMIRKAKVEIKGGKAEIIFSDLPFGTYAASIFHDENNNNELDKGTFGIPKEKYGYSNNAMGSFGPAKWEAAKFSFNKAELTINITVK